MDVFLIPTGPAEHELYYEPPPEADASAESTAPPAGMFGRWMQSFRQTLKDAEEERVHPSAVEPEGMLARGRRRMLSFVVEKIAEWRLLWHLRRAEAVTAHVPADLEPDHAERSMKAMLKSDGDRHLRWVVIDLVLLALTTPLALVPGPNVLAYYFIFNVVGHFLAMRGARRGLHDLEWRVVATPALTDLRSALRQDAANRDRTVREVESRLQLQHLAQFFQRLAVPTA